MEMTQLNKSQPHEFLSPLRTDPTDKGCGQSEGAEEQTHTHNPTSLHLHQSTFEATNQIDAHLRLPWQPDKPQSDLQFLHSTLHPLPLALARGLTQPLWEGKPPRSWNTNIESLLHHEYMEEAS